MKIISRALLVALLAVLAMAPGTATAGRSPMVLGIARAAYKSVTQVENYKRTYGTYPAIWSVWSDWGGPPSWRDFPSSFMNQLKNRRILPMVNWEPVDPAHQGQCEPVMRNGVWQPGWALDHIIDGSHDAYINTWATAAKNYGGKILLRFAHEMNGYWFIWGEGRCDNTPAKFIAAWKHVWNIFRGPGGIGAYNVKFVWSIYASNIKNYFPGDSYVDFLGTTAFSWGPDRWVSMTQALNPSMTALLALPSTKPIIAAELAAAPYKSCSNCKWNWIKLGYPAAYYKWDRLKAIVYFDIDMRDDDQPDWRLHSPANAWEAYAQIAADPRFKGHL